MNWIKEHKILSSLIFVVLALIIIISASFIAQGSNTAVGRIAKSVVYTIEKPLFNFGNSVKSTFKGLFDYKDLMAENESLKEENIKLKKELMANSLNKQDLEELNELALALNYDFVDRGVNVVSANVISRDNTMYFNMFTIDRGSDDGIKKDDVVIVGEDLVGTIYEVGNDYSKVISIIDQQENISFEVYRDVSNLGIISGDGNGGIKGYMLDGESKVVEGDIIVTSKTSIYPEGIEIGKVLTVTYNQDTQIKNITVEPSADLSKLRKVSVII